MMKQIKALIAKSDYTKHVSTLVSGTVISQGVFFLSSIVIARLYTPVELSIFATFFSMTFILSSSATLKYEHAIIIEKDDTNAQTLLVSSLVLSALFNVLCLLAILLFADQLSSLVSTEDSFVSVLYFVPFASFLLSVYNCFKNFSNRNTLYKAMATNKVIDSSTISVAQIVFGALKVSFFGLILGYIVSKITSVFHFVFKTKHLIEIKKITKDRAWGQIHKYSRFPKYALPGETVGTVSDHLPVLLIGRYFGGQALGNYSLVERVLTAPSSLIGGAVLDVFKQKASIEYLTHGNCKKLYTNTLKVLVALAVLPTLILYFFGQELFVFVFGKQWIQAGEYAEIMALLFFFRFVAAPLTYMFYITHKQNYDAIWQVGLFVVTAASFGFGVIKDDIRVTLAIYAIAYSCLYVISTWVCYRLASGKYR